MNSPLSFKREAEDIRRRPHTTTRGRVVSDLSIWQWRWTRGISYLQWYYVIWVKPSQSETWLYYWNERNMVVMNFDDQDRICNDIAEWYSLDLFHLCHYISNFTISQQKKTPTCLAVGFTVIVTDISPISSLLQMICNSLNSNWSC